MIIKNMVLSLFLFFFLVYHTYGQWNFVPVTEFDRCIVSIESKSLSMRPDQTGAGTGILVARKQLENKKFLYTILTCHHMKSNSSYKVRLYNGETYYASYIKSNYNTDLMWLTIESLVDINVANLGKLPDYKAGEEVVVCGLGEKLLCTPDQTTIRKFKTKLCPYYDSYIHLESPVINGDSGGGVFNTDGKLIGIVSGGWKTFDKRLVWPGTASGVENIVELFKQ